MTLLKDLIIGALLGTLFALPLYISLVRQEQIEREHHIEIVRNQR